MSGTCLSILSDTDIYTATMVQKLKNRARSAAALGNNMQSIWDFCEETDQQRTNNREQLIDYNRDGLDAEI